MRAYTGIYKIMDLIKAEKLVSAGRPVFSTKLIIDYEVACIIDLLLDLPRAIMNWNRVLVSDMRLFKKHWKNLFERIIKSIFFLQSNTTHFPKEGSHGHNNNNMFSRFW